MAGNFGLFQAICMPSLHVVFLRIAKAAYFTNGIDINSSQKLSLGPSHNSMEILAGFNCRKNDSINPEGKQSSLELCAVLSEFKIYFLLDLKGDCRQAFDVCLTDVSDILCVNIHPPLTMISRFFNCIRTLTC